ncbi:ADP-ribosylglycohydrolase [Aspergillus sp. HF37]|nr:ADP-ribosylglycohydrolase [Aspergillus sp. HF37]
MASTKARALGSIWGVCVGDALGGPVQSMPAGGFERITGLRAVKPFQIPAGSYSDDGSMTLALAQSFIDTNGRYNHGGSIQYFTEWLASGRFSGFSAAWDVGMSTRTSLAIWGERGTRDIEATQGMIDQRLGVEKASGNGSLMRIAPVGVVMWRDGEEGARKRAREQSGITHPALACVEACELYTVLMGRVMRGDDKETLAQTVSDFKISHSALAQRLARYKSIANWKQPSESAMQSSGWVVDTLEVALWGFFKYDSWADGALAVVNLGGDSDTAGAVYGGLAGAFYGVEAIPAAWVEGMQNWELIRRVAGGVAELV